MKGIVLAGGIGSRLWSITRSVSKQLLPIYDKPMIYYPISTLMLAGIREILTIRTPHDQSQFKQLLGDGSELGVSFMCAAQPAPKGLTQAFMIEEEFLSGESCIMILGDNIFHGAGLGRDIIRELPSTGAHIFTYEVSNPPDYGILEVGPEGNPISITEKPKNYISNLAVTGLYFFDSKVSEVAKKADPSARGEIDITSVIDDYLQTGSLTLTKLSRGAAWLDTGNPDSLNDAAAYVRIIEDKTGLKIACLEEIAFSQGWMTKSQFQSRIKQYKSNSYAQHFRGLIEN